MKLKQLMVYPTPEPVWFDKLYNKHLQKGVRLSEVEEPKL